jgi:hypothetical protein
VLLCRIIQAKAACQVLREANTRIVQGLAVSTDCAVKIKARVPRQIVPLVAVTAAANTSSLVGRLPMP